MLLLIKQLLHKCEITSKEVLLEGMKLKRVFLCLKIVEKVCEDIKAKSFPISKKIAQVLH